MIRRRSSLYFDEPIDWSGDGKPGPYRQFRQRVINSAAAQRELEAQLKSSRRGWYDAEAPSPVGLTHGKRIIKAFRSQVERRAYELCVAHPANVEYVRRALRIPLHIPPKLSWTGCLTVALLSEFAPLRALRIGMDRVRSVRTFEGRALVFQSLARSASMKYPYYSEALDLMIRNFDPPESWAALEEVQHYDTTTVSNAIKLGVSSFEELHTAFTEIHRKLAPQKLFRLIDADVIQSIGELSWLQPWFEESGIRHWDDAEHERWAKPVCCLVEVGVPREHALRALDSWYAFEPEQFNRTLKLLAARGYKDVPLIYSVGGDLLWKANPKNWDFVIDVIGAKDPSTWRNLSEFLTTDDALPSHEEIRDLLIRGASLEDLSNLQSFLLKVKRNGRDLRPFLKLMCSDPHSLTITDLSACTVYATRRPIETLTEYIGVLERYALGKSDGVLAFQKLYQSDVSARDLDRMLCMCAALRDAPKSAEAKSNWTKGIDTRRLSSLQYLVSVLHVQQRAAFDQIQPLGLIERSVLEYAVDVVGLRTIPALRAWQKRSQGVETVRWSVQWHEAIPRLLIDDAARRGNFSFLEGNLSAVRSATQNELDRVLDRAIDYQEGPERDAYWAHRKEMEPKIHARLLPGLQRQLEATGGMIAAALATAYLEGQGQYEEALESYRLAVESLIKGKGPASATLTRIESEALNAVYGAEVSSSDSRWKSVTNLQNHLGTLKRRDRYEMVWHSRPVELKRPIDVAGVAALQEALGYGDLTRSAGQHGIVEANSDLSWKLVGDRSAGPQTFIRHLGVLLGILPESNFEDLRGWIDRLADKTSEVSPIYRAMERVVSFFDIGLVDALQTRIPVLALALSKEEAQRLASLLAGSRAHRDEAGSHHRLSKVLNDVVAQAGRIYGTWAHRQF